MTSARRAVLSIPDFRRLLTVRFGSWFGLQIQAVIVGWQIYQLRPDPLLLGLVGLAEAVPAIGCAFISGHLVDAKRPALILRSSVSSLILISALLWFATAPFFDLATDLRIALLYLAVFLSGAARAFTGPAVFALTPQVVPREQLAAAAAWNGTTFQISAILGPAIGGFVYALVGPAGAFALPLVAQIAALSAALSLSPETTALRSKGHSEPFLPSVIAGLKFTFNNKVLLSAMTLDMFSVLFGGAVAVLPMYADQVLHVGATGLGWLRAAPSLGSVVVALVLAVRPMRVMSGSLLLWVVAGFGVSTLLFALSTDFVWSMIFLAASGVFDGVSMVIRQTFLQLLTPDHLRGRVSSVSSVFITSSNEIGAFESGLAARWLGLVPSVVFGGAMTLVIVGLTAWFSPDFRKTKLH